MLVKEIRKKTEKKMQILLEDGTSFVLYTGEVRRFGIRPEEELPAETYEQILQEVLTRRSRLRCMNLLKASDRTVGQLRDTLKRDGYPEEIIEQALDYVASYHYTDDERYAQNYVRQMSGRKSRKQIEFELLKKGVDRDTVRAALSGEQDEDNPEDPDVQAILNLARKRRFDPDTADRAESEKFIRYLLGKGFGFSSIRTALSSSVDAD